MWLSIADYGHTRMIPTFNILLSPLQMETVTKILIKMHPSSTDGATSILISVLLIHNVFNICQVVCVEGSAERRDEHLPSIIPNYHLHLHPPVIIHNLLPYDLHIAVDVRLLCYETAYMIIYEYEM